MEDKLLSLKILKPSLIRKFLKINGINIALWLSQEKKSEKAQVDIFSLKSSTEEIQHRRNFTHLGHCPEEW